MFSNPYEGQFEQQVLSADPVELIAIVFDHLIASIAEARRHLLSGDRAARARCISKAFGLIGELSNSLDDQQGGEIALNLRRLYGFVGNRLVQAQSYQIEQPLIEAIQTLEPLRQAWKTLCRTRAEDMRSQVPVPGSSKDTGLAVRA
jgi:flagellar protein FliS